MFRLVCIFFLMASSLSGAVSNPNVILIFTDDQGYGDLGCFGSVEHKTPNIDQLAEEGIRLTDFYSAANFCSPSRAGLLTGCYPGRVGFGPGVLRPDSEYGLNSSEMTMAEMFKAAGYVTSCIGKWHIGFKEPFLPNSQGFDEYYGILHNMDEREMDDYNGEMPVFRNSEVVKKITSSASLTEWYTEEATSFIERNKDKPFFLYLSHTMAHYPFEVTEKFAGKSNGGIYGDVTECLDWSTGKIIKKIKDLKLDRNTVVLYISDNGGHKGKNGVLRGTKGSCWEGGMRVPALAWGPGIIRRGIVSQEIASSIDLLPTFASWLGITVPNKVDGQNILPLLKSSESSGRKYFHYFDGLLCMAVRDERFKLHKNIHGDFTLYDLKNDIGEKKDVLSYFPEVAARLKKVMLDYEYRLNKERRMPGRIAK